jgi:HPt (histidine-containing phosphotransfer) domain-containing protein
MHKLEVLDLQSNKLTHIPFTIARPLLQELYLNDNMLQTIPTQIGVQLHSLRKLVLHHNNISHLPEQLVGLHNLKLLSLHSNKLEYLPYTVDCLSSLKTLELANNRLKELPPSITVLHKLRRVELQGNCFATLANLRGINTIESLKSLQFDSYLQDGHSERCMCKFCIYSRFDEAHFDDIVEGDSSFEAELIQLFFNCTENDLRAMEEALASNNFQGIFFVSHKIKGALSNMGALKLSGLCTVLERQARTQSIAACRDVFGQLQMEYGHIKQVLARRLESRR